MSIDKKINEITGSIQKEQWRMKKEKEICSEKHSAFLENLCFVLFDISEALEKGNTNTDIPIKEVNASTPSVPVSSPTIISHPETMKPIPLVKEYEDTVANIENVSKEVIPTLKEEKEDDFLMDMPEDIPAPETIYEKEENLESSAPKTINGTENVADFTYAYQKYIVRHNGVSEEVHVSAFPLTKSKEECVNVPIVTSIRYNGNTLNISSLDNPENRPSLICDLYDFKLNIRGYVDEKGKFHVSVVGNTPGYEVACLTSTENTNEGSEFSILTDTWEDKTFYAFPLNLEIDEFLIIAKSDEFTDYNITNEKKAAPIIAYENEEDKSKQAFVKCQLGDNGYEFVSKIIE